MGSKCCTPQPSPITNLINYNNQLKKIILQRITNDNITDQWAAKIRQIMLNTNAKSKQSKEKEEKCLYLMQYEVDIERLKELTQNIRKYNSTITQDEDYNQRLAKSCLVPEDQVENISNKVSQNDISSLSMKIQKNPSFMMQFDTIVKPFFQDGPYKENIKIFLKWITIADKHLENGFLKPLYKEITRNACHIMSQIKTKDPEILLTKLHLLLQPFVKLMHQVYFAVYHISDISSSQKGKIFKQQNINHFIISKIFTFQNFDHKLTAQLISKQKQYIQAFQMKLNLLQSYSFDYFNIPSKFQLLTKQNTITQSKSITPVISYISAVNTLKKITLNRTPISKLKVLLQVQKQIVRQIESYYKELDQHAPEIDSDTITSLTIFVIIKSKVKELPVELRIIETFSSKNALNSISGYYISTFSVAISMIDNMGDS